MIHTDRSVGSAGGNDDPESRYGEPQHEQPDDGLIEFERYGEPNHETASPAFEFVAGIEYPTDAEVSWSATRSAPEPLVIGRV
jgi:hypothetical protein